jgi:hypothetical protein
LRPARTAHLGVAWGSLPLPESRPLFAFILAMLLPALAATLLEEIVGGRLSDATLAKLGVEQGPGYNAERPWRAPCDQYGDVIVPGDWPVNPPGRLA